VERRLAAILAADVVGYSRLMGADERGTLERLKRHRRELIEPKLDQHRGRIVKLMGDGALAEFASAVDAVQCAAEIQQAMAERNRAVPEPERIAFRIGVNLGDVLVEGDDIYGDGVNVASRLESLAEPGGVCISAKVHDEVRDRLDLAFDDLGGQEIKNIARPVRVYKVVLSPAVEPAQPSGSAPIPSLPDKPSIVVLAFQNMSGDPEQEYFADGIAEDLITDLSKVSGLFVIARNSAFTYKGKPVNLQQVSRELGVRYVLEGSVRRAGSRVRITAQLIDGSSGGHVWAERYDRDLHDVFEVQDEVTREIVAALKVHLTPDERRRVAGHGTDSIEAYDCLLRGRKLAWHHTREATASAQALFEQAITLDAAFPLAHAYLAFTHALEYVNRWSGDPEKSLERAQQLVDRALQLDPSEAQAHFVQGVVHVWQKQVDQAIADAEKAIALDPNLADGYGLLANALHYAGRSAEASPVFDRLVRLDPHYPAVYQHFMAQGHFALGRYDEAITALKSRLARQPDSDISRVLLAACYGHLGRAEAARAEWEEALRINPDYSIEHRRQILPYKNPADFERMVEGLRKAGIAV
jgi:TolB-like protein/Tfp pilus assembly protein PilF